MFRPKELGGLCGSLRSLPYRFYAAILYRNERKEPQGSQSENKKQVL
jgi:hypothetical protein